MRTEETNLWLIKTDSFRDVLNFYLRRGIKVGYGSCEADNF